MCFIWNKSGEIENGNHKNIAEAYGQEWAQIKHVVSSKVAPKWNRPWQDRVPKHNQCISSSEEVPTSRGSRDVFW